MPLAVEQEDGLIEELDGIHYNNNYITAIPAANN
jgi:hypothetical protein